MQQSVPRSLAAWSGLRQSFAVDQRNPLRLLIQYLEAMRQMIECGRSQPSVATQPSSFLEKHRRPYFGRELQHEEKPADDLRGRERGPRRLHVRWVPFGVVPVGSSYYVLGVRALWGHRSWIVQFPVGQWRDKSLNNWGQNHRGSDDCRCDCDLGC